MSHTQSGSNVLTTVGGGVWEDVGFGIVLVAGHKVEEPVVMHTQQMNPLNHARRGLTSLGD